MLKKSVNYGKCLGLAERQRGVLGGAAVAAAK